MTDIDAQFSEYIGMLVRGFPSIPKDDITRMYNETLQQVPEIGNKYYIAYWRTTRKLEATMDLEKLEKKPK
jgi:hypothetical protein